MAIEIVSFPIVQIVIFHSYARSSQRLPDVRIKVISRGASCVSLASMVTSWVFVVVWCKKRYPMDSRSVGCSYIPIHIGDSLHFTKVCSTSTIWLCLTAQNPSTFPMKILIWRYNVPPFQTKANIIIVLVVYIVCIYSHVFLISIYITSDMFYPH